MADLIKKTKVVPFINTGTKTVPKWTQIKKSTTFTLSMNPQTKTYDFISSETPQNEIVGYQPSLSQSLTMFKGEGDYEAIFDMLFNRATGEDAHRDVLIAFFKEKGSYTPRRFNCILQGKQHIHTKRRKRRSNNFQGMED